MAKKRKVVRRQWTKDDLRLLKSMAKDKQGVKKIAKALSRGLGRGNDWPVGAQPWSA
jgi:hypothetical protein